jgi:ketosteroid isomerase-like protein
MKYKRVVFMVLLFSLSLMFVCTPGTAQDKGKAPEDDVFKTVKGTVAELYKMVTFGPGVSPDWEKVKTFFIPEAVIVLRTARDKMSVLSRDGFVKLFIDDIKKYKMDETGFQEKLISCKIKEFGNIAFGVAVYEASIPGSSRPPQRGVDGFQLMKKDGRWWIVSIVNEIPLSGNPIPEEFLK